MGAMDEHQYEMKLEGALNLGCMKTGMEIEPEIQAAVRILLQGLGEDVDREGIKKTPLRVAKALRDGTKGMLVLVWLLPFYLLIPKITLYVV